MKTYVVTKPLPGIEVGTKLILDESQTIFKMRGLITVDYRLFVIPFWQITPAINEHFIEPLSRWKS